MTKVPEFVVHVVEYHPHLNSIPRQLLLDDARLKLTRKFGMMGDFLLKNSILIEMDCSQDQVFPEYQNILMLYLSSRKEP